MKETAASTSKKAVTISNYKSQSSSEVAEKLQAAGLVVTVLGNKKQIQAQSTPANQELFVGSRIILKTGGTMTMPDIKGWSRSDVVKLATILGLKLKIVGAGYVSEQSVVANSNLSGVKELTVKLS